MTPQERRNKLREVEAELGSAMQSMRIARSHNQNTSYRERRIQSVRDEIEDFKRKSERTLARMQRDLKQLEDETTAYPMLMDATKKRVERLEHERKLLQNSEQIAKIYKVMEQLESVQ